MVKNSSKRFKLYSNAIFINKLNELIAQPVRALLSIMCCAERCAVLIPASTQYFSSDPFLATVSVHSLVLSKVLLIDSGPLVHGDGRNREYINRHINKSHSTDYSKFGSKKNNNWEIMRQFITTVIESKIVITNR